MNTTTEPTPRFLSVADAAELLAVSDSMIRKLLRSRELKALQVGSSWRLCRKSLEEWIIRKLDDAAKKAAAPPEEEMPQAPPPAPKGRGKKRTS